MADFRPADEHPATARRTSGGARTVWIILLVALALVALLFATGFFSARVTDEGELPSISVKADEGRLPEVDVDSKEVVVGTKKTTIEVPTVETKKETIDVPVVGVKD
jgi:hypothetical protein